MRIIRIVVILLAALAIILPQLASANETINTETKTKSTFSYIYNLLAPETVQAEEATQLIEEQIEKEKTPEEIKREAILAKWREKQTAKWTNLPKESFTINASAYTASADECDNDLGITASGIKVQANRTIACPPEFPFGAKIEIEGMGTYICEDRGGAIKGNKIDIYMETKTEAFAFGRQNLMAKVVE
ncbi:MAG: protein YuiC [uncultured bacterium]|nr:MAG: protein YuiC [uncultured bacterium]